MHGIFHTREKKEIIIADLEISKMNCKEIILEIKNRLEFICYKTGISKRKLSHILNKPDGYISHRFSYNDKLNMTVFIDIIKIFGISLETFFQPKKEDFLTEFNNTEFENLKNNVTEAYKAIEIRQLRKESNNLMTQLNEDKSLKDYKRILVLKKLMRKLKKLKKILENKRLYTTSEEELNKLDNLLKDTNVQIKKTKTQLEKL